MAKKSATAPASTPALSRAESSLATLTAAIVTKLSASQRSAWTAVKVEARPKALGYNIRMPGDSKIMDALWDTVLSVGLELGVPLRRTGVWHTVEELDDHLGDVQWLWHNWLAMGFLTLLVGEPGTGKSMLALDIIKRVIQPELGWPLSPAPAPNGHGLPKREYVVWVETEASQQMLRQRSASMGLLRDHLIIPPFEGNDLMSQPDMGSEEHKRILQEHIAGARPKLVVVDSLGGAHSRGENRIEDVRPMLDYLARLSRDYQFSMLGIHHLRKRGPQEDWGAALERVRGSTAFIAYPRVVLGLDTMPASDALKWAVIKSNIGRKPTPITATVLYDEAEDPNPIGVSYGQYNAPPPKQTRKQLASDWVAQYLKSNGRQDFTELCLIAQAEGYNRSMLYATREALRDVLLVTGTGKRVTWELATPENPLTGHTAYGYTTEQDPQDV